MDKLNCFIFYDTETKSIEVPDRQPIDIPPRLKDRHELFELFYHRFKFPHYFGFNWDALHDFLSELDWIQQKNIILMHHDIPLEDDKDKRSYIASLEKLVDHWKQYKDHTFTVYFPKELEAGVKNFMKSDN